MLYIIKHSLEINPVGFYLLLVICLAELENYKAETNSVYSYINKCTYSTSLL